MMNEIVRQVQKPISPNPQKRLLIVDDCDRTRAALKALLGAGKETAVFTLIEATNGQEAVELCQYNPPDLVLLDVNMPGVNGLQAAQLIKKEHPTIKIIMLSIDAAYEAEAGAVGADAFLVKSGSPAVLLETIRKLIARAGTVRRPARAGKLNKRTGVVRRPARAEARSGDRPEQEKGEQHEQK